MALCVPDLPCVDAQEIGQAGIDCWGERERRKPECEPTQCELTGLTDRQCCLGL